MRFVILAMSCAHGVGTPADVRVADGMYTGYRVVRCTGVLAGSISVVGLGLRPFDWTVEPGIGQRSTPSRRMERFRREVASVAGGDAAGFGGGCAASPPTFAVHLYTSSYREIDGMVERTGEWLARHDLHGEIIIGYMGRPRPL